jgi:hypothetical protein
MNAALDGQPKKLSELESFTLASCQVAIDAENAFQAHWCSRAKQPIRIDRINAGEAARPAPTTRRGTKVTP